MESWKRGRVCVYLFVGCKLSLLDFDSRTEVTLCLSIHRLKTEDNSFGSNLFFFFLKTHTIFPSTIKFIPDTLWSWKASSSLCLTLSLRHSSISPFLHFFSASCNFLTLLCFCFSVLLFCDTSNTSIGVLMHQVPSPFLSPPIPPSSPALPSPRQHLCFHSPSSLSSHPFFPM